MKEVSFNLIRETGLYIMKNMFAVISWVAFHCHLCCSADVESEESDRGSGEWQSPRSSGKKRRHPKQSVWSRGIHYHAMP